MQVDTLHGANIAMRFEEDSSVSKREEWRNFQNRLHCLLYAAETEYQDGVTI